MRGEGKGDGKMLKGEGGVRKSEGANTEKEVMKEGEREGTKIERGR